MAVRRPSRDLSAPVVVVGSGIAGLSFALKATRHAPVLLLTKKNAVESNTNYAQGGIACVTSALFGVLWQYGAAGLAFGLAAMCAVAALSLLLVWVRPALTTTARQRAA